MAEETQVDIAEADELPGDPIEDVKTTETGKPLSPLARSKVPAAPVKAPETVKPLSPLVDKESYKSRRGRDGKVFTNGFSIPGFNSYSDLPGKTCVDCGFNALKFSKQCPKCGGELGPEVK